MESVYFLNEELIRAEVEKIYHTQRSLILTSIVEADVQHVGSTAVPGSLTKGDLDIQVRVQPETFATASKVFSSIYDVNKESDCTECFMAFKKEGLQFDLGIQLSVIHSPYDIFWKIRDFFLKHKEWNVRYNALKTSFQNKNMSDYRSAKNAFFERLISSAEFQHDFPSS